MMEPSTCEAVDNPTPSDVLFEGFQHIQKRSGGHSLVKEERFVAANGESESRNEGNITQTPTLQTPALSLTLSLSLSHLTWSSIH
jgi:hypothetical protein